MNQKNPKYNEWNSQPAELNQGEIQADLAEAEYDDNGDELGLTFWGSSLLCRVDYANCDYDAKPPSNNYPIASKASAALKPELRTFRSIWK